MMNKPTVIISGASRGLGLAAARFAAADGANVVLLSRSVERLAEAARLIEAEGGTAVPIPGDVTDAEDCAYVVAAALERYGRIDALINNAGTIEPIAPVAEADVMAWQENWAVNLLGPLQLTQVALPHLRERRGRVINVSSGAATYGLPGWGAYCAAKGALNQLTRVLAVEEPLITAVAVRPGAVDTAMQQVIREQGAAGMAPDVYERFVRKYEDGQLLPPDKPGAALAALALYAPPEWSGEFVAWDEAQVQALLDTNIGS
ncbi:MAG TPA: SDR family NAD(P)-dependent oxidoreductase [Anaerolineae bacterium]|nr:SDR family NAD(P)-dependent oxidoreductase [Anaerolineae bacterium]